MATAPPDKRRRLDPDARREEVLATATELFEEAPYDQLTIEQIAEGCGVSVGLLYHYFGNKRELYVACLERSIGEFIGGIVDPGPEIPLEDRVRLALDSYLDFVVDHPRSYSAVLRGGIGQDDQVHALTEDARERFAELVLRGLGVSDPSPTFVLALWGWMGFVEAACTRWLRDPVASREELRELLLNAGLATFSGAQTKSG